MRSSAKGEVEVEPGLLLRRGALGEPDEFESAICGEDGSDVQGEIRAESVAVGGDGSREPDRHVVLMELGLNTSHGIDVLLSVDLELSEGHGRGKAEKLKG